MRQGCARAAAVSLVFDAVGREVWLDAVADGGVESAGGSQAQLLCPDHAEALRVPVGWAVVDRRPPLSPRADDGDVADEPIADEPLADEPSADEPSTDEPSADEPAADEAGPTGGAASERRSGSMLDRAFAWAGPQRSVITDRGGPVDPDDSTAADRE